ncbi:MAG TPA: hypothetical protein ENG42_03295, partial [Candidatus Aenigmarchaeota archaeon]|nr:hypothetical protein [Candidatus Aenigmarchaeota archaeon]
VKKDEILRRINEKEKELSGLISKEGAAYIVASELGVNLLKERERRLKIKNIISGMNNIELVAKIAKISDIINFEREGRAGRLINMYLGDETGLIRLPLWNDECKIIENAGIKEGDVIKLSNVFSRENNGIVELRLGSRGRIEKVEDVSIELKDMPIIDSREFKKANIADIEKEGYYEVRASIVHVFKKSPFFYLCPLCNTKVEKSEDGFYCPTHKKIEPVKRLVLSTIIDDGTSSMRCVFFGDVAKYIIKDAEHVDEDKICDNVEVGKDFIIKGKAKLNEFSGEYEIIVSKVSNVKHKELIGELETIVKGLKE